MKLFLQQLQLVCAASFLIWSHFTITDGSNNGNSMNHRSASNKHNYLHFDSESQHQRKRIHSLINNNIRVVDNGLPRSTTSSNMFEEVFKQRTSQSEEDFLFILNNTRHRVTEAMGGVLPAHAKPQDYVYNIHNIPFEDMMDIAFIFENSSSSASGEDPVDTNRIFENWRSAAEGYHVIIIADNDIAASITIPEWMMLDYELYSRSDLVKTILDLNLEEVGPMHELKHLLDGSLANPQVESANTLTGVELVETLFNHIGLHSFAAWISDRDYIYIVDNDCIPPPVSVEYEPTGTVSGSRNIHTGKGFGQINADGTFNDVTKKGTNRPVSGTASKVVKDRRRLREDGQHRKLGIQSHSSSSSTNSGSDSYVPRHKLFEQHIANLRTASAPHYYNSLGDPFAPGNDFSHSHPYHLRGAVGTAMSHGMFIGDKHYDSLTRLVKIPGDFPQYSGNNKRDFGDAATFNHHMEHTDVIPSGMKFSLSRSNLAVNRQLLGAAMLFYGSSNKLKKVTQEDIMLANYHDIITGWMLKIVIDECNYGAKSGAPYVIKQTGREMKRSNVDKVDSKRRKLQSSSTPTTTTELNSTDLKQHTKAYLRSRLPATATSSTDTSSSATLRQTTTATVTPLIAASAAKSTGTTGSSSVQQSTQKTTVVDDAAYQDKLFRAHKKRVHNELMNDVKSNFTFMANATEIYEFFSTYKLDRNAQSFWKNEDCNSKTLRVECVYKELATAMEKSAIAARYPHFKLLGVFMKLWVTLWQSRHSFLGTTFPRASRSSMGPQYNKKVPKCAMVTITHNEAKLFPVWMRYHMRHFLPSDIFVLDHITTDNSTHPSKIPYGVNIMHLEGNRYTMPVLFRSQIIKVYQDRLLRSGYSCVVFSDTDEIIVPNPLAYKKGLGEYLTKFASDPSRVYHRVTAWELGHMSWGNGSVESQEPALDWSRSVLSQRSFYAKDTVYNKPLLTKVPMTYRPGFHRVYDIWLDRNIPTDTDLVMFHLRSMDSAFCFHREVEKYNMTKTMEQGQFNTFWLRLFANLWFLAEINAGFASHWNAYERDKKSGELCKYAIGCFVGPLSRETKLWDNTGVFPMLQLDPQWKTVEM